ncbi:MAG TPA: alkaline phosphatase family protein [Candidatus Cybelea sp.]|jgi:phospholipase C|nr:alkaline phosphatase family protein [Candidatus Cybelea sp.]
MSNLRIGRYALSLCGAASLLAGCGARPTADMVPGTGGTSALQSAARATGTRPIQNVIVILQENRSFDNLFAGYPGANAPTQGLTSTGKYVPLRPIRLQRTKVCVTGYSDEYFKTAYDDGKMDGWNLLDPEHPLCPYSRVVKSEVRQYWDLAEQYVLADKMFASTTYGDFVNPLYIIAGTTEISRNEFVVGQPDNTPWGCDAPAGTTTSLLKNGRFQNGRGPFPCFSQFPTIADLLDRANVSWRFYFGGTKSEFFPFNPFEAIENIREGSDWGRDMSVPATNVLRDLAGGNLPSVSWVLSPLRDSDLPGYGGGPKWVNSIVGAARKSSYWKHLAIFVIWQSPGNENFYDNVAPPQLDAMGLGFRVPMIAVSPYAKRRYVSHVPYEFGSILKFIEQNWRLGSLGATDRRANGLNDIFTQ